MMDEKKYKEIDQKITPNPPYLKNVAKAFLVGGIICTIGQAVSYFYIIFFDFTEQTAGNPTVATMIFFAMLLTGFGLYKKIGQLP